MFKPIFPVLVALAFSGCARNSGGDGDYEVLRKEDLACTPPAVMEVQPWGKEGLSRSCSIKSGEFVAAEAGYIHIRGQYEAGKQTGVWRWYDRQGNVVKVIDYSSETSR